MALRPLLLALHILDPPLHASCHDGPTLTTQVRVPNNNCHSQADSASGNTRPIGPTRRQIKNDQPGSHDFRRFLQRF